MPKLEALAKPVAEMAFRQQDPAVQIPIRGLSNISLNDKTRHIEMGDNKQARNFFNYGQAN